MRILKLSKFLLVSAVFLFTSASAWQASIEQTDIHYATRFEQYEQSWRKKKSVSQHALVSFDLIFPAKNFKNIKALLLEDPEGPGEIKIGIEGNDYYYENLFGKTRHYEQWRPHCTTQECVVNVLYYVNEWDNHIHDRTLTVKSLPDGETQKISFYSPNREDAAAQSYPPLEAKIEGHMVKARFDLQKMKEAFLLFQIRDKTGYHEEGEDVSGGGIVERSQALLDPVEYVGVLVSTSKVNNKKRVGWENKIELVNTSVKAK
jgi:hypothetical protein